MCYIIQVWSFLEIDLEYEFDIILNFYFNLNYQLRYLQFFTSKYFLWTLEKLLDSKLRTWPRMGIWVTWIIF